MSVQRAWARSAWAVALAGLALYATIMLAADPESGLNSFFSLWVYQGLVVFAVVIAGSRAIAVTRDRVAWTVVTVSLAGSAFAAFALERLGYRLTVIVLLAFLLGVMERKRPAVVVAVALGLSLGSFFLFSNLLKVPLPRGPWGL